MKSKRTSIHILYSITLFCLVFIQSSCSSDNEVANNDTPITSGKDLITLSRSKVDFGEVIQNNPERNENQSSKVIVTLTNNSTETLTSLDTAIEFPGEAGVFFTFLPIPPGASIDIPFTFSPDRLEPGMYSGKATLTPSIGEPLQITLEATVITPTDNNTGK